MTQITNNRNERKDSTRDIKRVIYGYYESLHANKFDDLDKMNKFLDTHFAETDLRKSNKSK